jgi:hypothetical protein
MTTVSLLLFFDLTSAPHSSSTKSNLSGQRLWRQALCSGVPPSKRLPLILAPFSSRSFTTATLLKYEVRCRGVRPSSPTASMSAPPFKKTYISRSETAFGPASAVMCRAVSPPGALVFASAPASSKTSSTEGCWHHTAINKSLRTN